MSRIVGIASLLVLALGLAGGSMAKEAGAGADAGVDAGALAARAADLVRAHYVDAEQGGRIAEAIERRNADGAYAGLDVAGFVDAISRDLRAAGNDSHLYVQRVERVPQAPEGGWEAAERQRELERNHGFTEVRVLPGNVGYLRVVEFMHPQRSFAKANAAMRLLQDTSAVILDLRDNHGGYGGLPEYLASFWFEDEPQLLSSVRTRATEKPPMPSWSFPAVEGQRRVGTPLYVLVDGGTASAAEWLAYTLQAFGKAKVVGERSAGGANHNEFFELAPGLRLSVSVASPVSAATGANWEGEGIHPDVPCAAADALEVALGLARE